MTADIIEHFESQEISRTFDESILEIKAHYIRNEDTAVVEAAFLAWLPTVPATSGGFLRSTNVKHLGDGVHECHATYFQDYASNIVKTLRYRTTGANTKVLQGYGSVYSVQRNPDFDSGAAPGPGNLPTIKGPDHLGLVNVDSEGVHGVDIPTPTFAFSVDFPFSSVDQAYLNLCYRLTGCVNTVPYLGHERGELLFTGIEGEVGMTIGGAIVLSGSPISFNFESSANATNLVVGPFTIPFKYGWDYLWPRTREEVALNSLVRVTDSVHIDRVLRWADLTQLGI